MCFGIVGKLVLAERGTALPSVFQRQPRIMTQGHLVLSPSQGVLYLLVALFDPASQSIESGHLRQIGYGVLSSLSLLGGIRSWQIAHQVGGAAFRQGCQAGGYYYQPLRSFGAVWSALCFQGPPLLDATVAKRAFQPHLISRLLGATPG